MLISQQDPFRIPCRSRRVHDQSWVAVNDVGLNRRVLRPSDQILERVGFTFSMINNNDILERRTLGRYVGKVDVGAVLRNKDRRIAVRQTGD